MAGIPDGMSAQTFEYVIRFTIDHEGDTPFMYNNWPIKNPNKDVTVGVGRALHTENDAVASEIKAAFTVRTTGLPATDQDMRAEFRRVYNLARTPTNLRTDYRDKSPLQMDREAMLRNLRKDMLGFWGQRGQQFLNFESIPAQAQVVLMSWNYGARLLAAPKMCNAVRAADFVTAANETRVPTWDAQKNEAHRRLMLNAAAIVGNGGDIAKLPPVEGPFKPPPAEQGSTTTLNTTPRDLPGRWTVSIGSWQGIFFFDPNGGVYWANNDYGPKHRGRWLVRSGRLEWKFNDAGDFRTFTVQLPMTTGGVDGTILPTGQGWFTMSKSSVGVA